MAIVKIIDFNRIKGTGIVNFNYSEANLLHFNNYRDHNNGIASFLSFVTTPKIRFTDDESIGEFIANKSTRLPKISNVFQSLGYHGTVIFGLKLKRTNVEAVNISYSKLLRFKTNNSAYEYSYFDFNFELGAEYYFEVVLKLEARKIEVYVNDVLSFKTSYNSIQSFHFEVQHIFDTQEVAMTMSDIYLIHDKLNDPNPTGRLGPVKVRGADFNILSSVNKFPLANNEPNTINHHKDMLTKPVLNKDYDNKNGVMIGKVNQKYLISPVLPDNPDEIKGFQIEALSNKDTYLNVTIDADIVDENQTNIGQIKSYPIVVAGHYLSTDIFATHDPAKLTKDYLNGLTLGFFVNSL